MRVRISTHEHVDGGVCAFRPSMNRDMTFREYRNTRDSTTWAKAMQVKLEQRCASGNYCGA